jgi:hypothetical protein
MCLVGCLYFARWTVSGRARMGRGEKAAAQVRGRRAQTGRWHRRQRFTCRQALQQPRVGHGKLSRSCRPALALPRLPTQTKVMPSHWYLAPDAVPREYDPSEPVVVAITNFVTSFILYSAPRAGPLQPPGFALALGGARVTADTARSCVWPHRKRTHAQIAPTLEPSRLPHPHQPVRLDRDGQGGAGLCVHRPRPQHVPRRDQHAGGGAHLQPQRGGARDAQPARSAGVLSPRGTSNWEGREPCCSAFGAFTATSKCSPCLSADPPLPRNENPYRSWAWSTRCSPTRPAP